MSRLFKLVVFASALIAVALPGLSTATQSRGALGSQLANRYLSDLHRHDMADLRSFLSPAFQVERANGLRQTKSELLRHPPKVGTYAIRRMRVTSTANVIVVTFEIAINEVINGKPFRTAYAPRLAMFTLVSKGWQLIGWANFNAPM
jgi:hypothetical protein